MKLQVVDFESNVVDNFELSDDIANFDPRIDLVTRTVKWQLAKARSGNHKTKGRSEVKHTTRKPFKQKGTGRARQGMLGVSQMRGGGVVFGPVVRDHSHGLQKKVRKIALKSVIVDKINNKSFIIVDKLIDNVAKTSEMVKILNKLNWKNVLFVDSNQINLNFKNAMANLIGVDVLPVIGLNVYDVMKHDIIVVTKDSMNLILERI
jgi:large subunit ribosomal protein L4